ncbi:HAMP domain-containing sensor histidine kinase [Novosphingobium sp.]|uniref:sensor histidine kinase n=1 Tax=Novosphingobium sp. TaxID=1874826 RepID=UPI0025F26906|nr:HAMP domain-containing sensor histidine kinase [Novosphingobium sp.]
MPRLRWLLVSVLLFAAALPGIAALGLRVYENALVRRTEAEVSAQAAALAASTALVWPGAQPAQVDEAEAPPVPEMSRLDPYAAAITTGIDLRSTPILPERPPALPARAPPDPAALAAAQRIAPALAETKAATLASIVLLDRDGVMVNGRQTGWSLGRLPEVRAALAGGSQTVMRLNSSYQRGWLLHWLSPATDIRLHHARAITVNGQVVGAVLVSRSPSALFRGMWEDWGKIAVGAGVIFVLLLAIAAVLARAIVVPVERLSDATRALAQGRSARLRAPTLEVREIRSLNADFALMAEAINRRSRYLRDFAASLSHEFKTPLAGIRGGLELLQDHGEGMSKAERARFLSNMEGDADRLSRLVSRLMELAQADMARGDSEARGNVAAVLARLADAHSSPQFAVTYTIEPDYPLLAIEEEALETVLATLIENARQAGASALAVTTGHRGRFAGIALNDNGPGVPEADRVRVFDPFFTSKRETGGTGLGLPIARALAESRGGSLELEESPRGACFVLTLPVAG